GREGSRELSDLRQRGPRVQRSPVCRAARRCGAAAVTAQPMEKLSAAARRLHAPLRGADADFTAVNTDTRTLKAGDLFVALKGEHFDGHEFVARAGTLGAVGALVSRPVENGPAQIVVPDTL